MTNDTPFDSTITIESVSATVDAFTLPNTSLLALIKRGIRVVLSTEASRAINTWKNHKDNADAIKAMTTEEFEAKLAELLETEQLRLWAKITNGTFGVREPKAAGPRKARVVDPVEKEARLLAKTEITNILKGMGLEFPTKSKTVLDANGTAVDGETLIERRMTKHGDRLRGEAKKIVAARERALAKASDSASAPTMADLN